MTESWLRVELGGQRLDWLPPVLAAMDLPFQIEGPQELRDLMVTFVERLAAHVRSMASTTGALSPDAT